MGDRSLTAHVFVTREGKVRARIVIGGTTVTTAPRDTTTEAALDVGVWIQQLDTTWPPEPEEGPSNA